MPTQLPRYQVTETEAIARALDRAAERWPGESRGRLLVRLIEAGGQVLSGSEDDERAAHRAAVLAVSGGFAGLYPAHYLEELRRDWPE